jgi:hypothetical protein
MRKPNEMNEQELEQVLAAALLLDEFRIYMDEPMLPPLLRRFHTAALAKLERPASSDLPRRLPLRPLSEMTSSELDRAYRTTDELLGFASDATDPLERYLDRFRDDLGAQKDERLRMKLADIEAAKEAAGITSKASWCL